MAGHRFGPVRDVDGAVPSGPTTGRPVLPPSGIASATAAVQAAWAALVAYYHRLRCGSRRLHRLLPVRGGPAVPGSAVRLRGQAAVGRKQSGELWRGRPRNQQIYPTFACRDGYVRICLLSARQWRGMRAWLGEPEQFADPKFETSPPATPRRRSSTPPSPSCSVRRPWTALVAEGQRRGVPIAAVLSPADALASDHFRAVGALAESDVAPGTTLTVPVGPFVVDGRHAGLERPCRQSVPRTSVDRGPPARPARSAPSTGDRSRGCGSSISA